MPVLFGIGTGTGNFEFFRNETLFMVGTEVFLIIVTGTDTIPVSNVKLKIAFNFDN
jgi:hypothetical protein